MGNRGSYIATAHYQSRWRSSSFAQIGKWYYKYQWGSPDVCNEHRAGWVRTHWWEKIRSLPFIVCKNSICWCLHDSLTIYSEMNKDIYSVVYLYVTKTARWDYIYKQWADLPSNGRKFKVLTHQVDHLRRTFKQQKIY